MCLKLQLLLPFGVALFCWIKLRRELRLLLGTAVGFTVALAVPLWLDHSIWMDYVPTIRKANADSYAIPTLSSLVRVVVSPQAQWLQLLPCLLACLWAMVYFVKHQDDWSWTRQGLLLLLVSILVAPYSWLSDQIIVLPAIMAANYTLARSGRSLLGFHVTNTAASLMVLLGVPMASVTFAWTALAWLVWFLFASQRGVDHNVNKPCGYPAVIG
jgi:hypothetical protein